MLQTLMSVLRALIGVTRTVTTTSAPTPAAVTLDTDSMLMDLLVMVSYTHSDASRWSFWELTLSDI